MADQTRIRLIVIVLLLAGSVVHAEDGVWTSAPFTAPADEVFAEADGLTLDTTDAKAVVLLDELRLRFDAEGRSESTRTLVYRMLTDLGVADWDTISSSWQPWHQHRPVLEARVMTDDGRVVMLDPDTISEAPAEDGGDDLFNDRRILEAPLPHVQVGCIVEERTTIVESQPRFPGGTSWAFTPGWSVPVNLGRLVVEVADELEFRWKAYLLNDVEPTVEALEGATRYTFEFPVPEMYEEPENSLPFDHPRTPRVAFSTGQSWTTIAAEYAAVVDEQIAATDASVLPARPETGSRLELIQAALDWVHEKVRYTGLEFGSSSIVPYPPGLALSRGYGDCKDQATMMVAVLRHWDTPANVALLRSGFGFDTDPDLPAIGAFNHAIVYVPGEEPLWVDPTAEFCRAGSLPSMDHGRWALVADPATTGLITTPELTSSDRGMRVTRVFTLADEGPAHLTVLTEPWGTHEAAYRSWATSRSVDEQRESIESWSADLFLTEAAAEFDYSDPNDLDVPFTMHVTFDEVRRGFTAYGDAVVVIRFDEFVTAFPEEIRGEDDQPRHGDFILFKPFRKVITTRAVPPTGFVAADLPEDRVTELGVALLEERYALTDDGAIEATITLDSGPRRLSADEFEATREALLKLGERDHVSLYFVHKGQHLLGQGRTAEALEELSRLAAAEPEVALHQVRLAQALNAVGIGDEARRMAASAVSINPDSVVGLSTLGWVLQHDLVGRRYGPGFDHAGAVEAYRKALELEDADLDVAVNLAILLEHDARGRRYSDEADLDAAIATYLEAREAYPDEFTYDHNLLVAMLWNRQYEKIVELYPELGASDDENAVILTAIAATKGVEEAHRRMRLKYRDAGKVRTMLTNVAQILAQQRFYPESAATFKLSAQGAADATDVMATAFVVGRTQRTSERKVDPTTAEGLILQIYALFGQADADDVIRRRFLSRLVRESYDEDQLEAAGLMLGASMERAARETGLPVRVVTDLALGGVEIIVEGSESDVRRVHLRHLTESGSDTLFFTIKEGDEFKLLATFDDLSVLGVVARNLLAEGNHKGAVELLDWARDLSDSYSSGDPLAGDPFARVWTSGKEEDPDKIRHAALILAGGGEAYRLIRSELEEVVETEADAEWIDELRLALASACRRSEDFGAVITIADALADEHPDSWIPVMLKSGALSELKRYDDAWEVTESFRKKHPKDTIAMRFAASAREAIGDVDGAIELYTKIISTSEALSIDFNNRAWLALFRKDQTLVDQAFLWAQAAVKRTDGRDSSYAALHTMATLFAQNEMPAEAYQTISKAIDPFDEPRSEDWFVFGRIAETYGFPDSARTAYQRVIDGEETTSPISTAVLARQRLSVMDSIDASE